MEGGELAFLVTHLDNRVDNVRTNILNSVQTKANVLTIRGKGTHRGIDIGGKNSNSHVAALRQIERTPILIVLRRGQKSGHVLGGIVCFKVGSPIRHQTVGCRVSLIECVGREGNNHIPQGLDGFFGIAVIKHALPEALELLVQNFLLLLTHGLTQDICLAKRVARKFLGNLHNLLLINNQTVGRSQNVLQRLCEFGVDRSDLLAPVLTQSVVCVRICTHRTGTIERTHSGDIFEVIRFHQLEKVTHTATIKLENAQGIAAAQ